MQNLVTGGAGFLGSHLIEKLINLGEEVICLDNLFTGSKNNIEKHFSNPLFNFIEHDVIEPISLEVDRIWHLACPASPVKYQKNPIETIKITHHCFLHLNTKSYKKIFILKKVIDFADAMIHVMANISGTHK